MMRRIVIGVVVLVVLAVGGYFGLAAWAQHRAEAEVEATFEVMRSAGATASHGKVSFDLLSRTLVVADIAVAQPSSVYPSSVRVGTMTAVGVGQPAAGRLSADRIELVDVTSEIKLTAPSAIGATYKVPRIEIVKYSGPAVLLVAGRNASFVDLLRQWLQQLAEVAVATVSIPTVTLSVAPEAPGKGPAGPLGITYSGIKMRDLHDRRTASITVDKYEVVVPVVAGGKALTIEVANVAVADSDFSAILAVLDPAGASDATYHQVYRNITIGAITYGLGDAGRAVIEGITLEDLALKPSKLRIDKLMALATSASTTPKPSLEQTRELLDQITAIYESMRIGKFELRGVAVTGVPNFDARIAAIRFTGFEDGRLAEFAIEGVDGHQPMGAFKLGRFALTGFNMVSTIRMAVQAASKPINPTDQAVALLRVLDGFSFKDLDVPSKPGERIAMQAFDAAWGRFVGPFPTNVHATLKITAPLDKGDANLRPLIAAGITTATVAAEVQAEWVEATKTLSAAPIVLEVAGMFSASAALSLGNVPRAIFTADPAAAMAASAEVEAGPVELMVRDTGGLDLALAQFAKEKGLSVDDARGTLVEMLSQASSEAVAQNPELKPVFDAVIKFVEVSKSTLRIKVTPKSHTAVMQLVADAKIGSQAVFARLDIEVSVSH